MKKIFLSNKNTIALIISFFLSLAVVRGLYNHLQLWQLALIVRLCIVTGLVLLVFFGIFAAAYLYAWQKIKEIKPWKRFLWIFLCIAGGVLLVYTLPLRIPVPELSHHLEIIATGEKSVLSSGSEVRILEIIDYHGDTLQSYAVQFDAEGWQEDGKDLVSNHRDTMNYYFNGGEGKEIKVLLSAHPKAGIVIVRLDGIEQEIDLYEADKGFTQITLAIPLNTKMMWFLFCMDIIGYSLLIFIFSVFLKERLSKNPGIVLIVVGLINALLILLAGMSEQGLYKCSWDFSPYQPPCGNIWLLALFFSLLYALITRRYRKQITLLGVSIPFLLMLAAAFYLLTEWNIFYISADSTNYVHEYLEQEHPTRPPLYPLFIQAATSGTGYDFSLGNLERGIAIYDEQHPLMRVAIAQKVTLFTAFLLLSAILMSVIEPSLIMLLLVWLYTHGFFSSEIHYILSEALTQTWMVLLIGVFFLFLWKRSKLLLLFAALFCAALILTRPAGVFGVGLVGGMMCWGLMYNWKNYWKISLLSVIVIVSLVFLPSIRSFLRTGIFTPSPMYYVTQIAFALEVAQPDDVAMMPDEQSREFLVEALQRKKQIDAQIKAEYPDFYLHRCWIILSNPYQVAIPLADEMVGDNEPDHARREALILKVAEPIIKNHYVDYIKVGLSSFQLATSERGTRIKTESMNIWTIMAICLILALFLRSWIGYSSLLLIISHFTHLLIISFHDSPSGRYTEATEFFVLIAIFILLWGVFDYLSSFIFQKIEVKKPISIGNND